MGELRHCQLATCEIRSERAFAIGAVAVLALGVGSIPDRLAGGGIALRLRGGLSERKHQKCSKKSLHRSYPPWTGRRVSGAKVACTLHILIRSKKTIEPFQKAKARPLVAGPNAPHAQAV
jgi:hypothetical protein